MGAKKKKEKKPGFVFVPPPVEELMGEEEEKSIVEFTDTSYTSASFESLPHVPIVEEHKKKKKKKKGEEEDEEKVEELFNYSAESIPPPPEEEEIKESEEKKEEKKEKGKGGKGKKGKKGKEEQKEVIPDFEKPKNWKKLDRKQQDKWLAERIEQWRVEQEAEKQARLANAKEKRKQEAIARAEKMQRDLAQQEIRRDLLQKTCILFERMENYKRNYDGRKQAKAEWAQYLQCDGLPDPRVVTQMATFLHRWKEDGIYNEHELDRRSAQCYPMLEMLEQFVANPRQYTKSQVANYNAIRIELRTQMALAIEYASYMLLRDVEKNLKASSIKISTYYRAFEGLKLNLWVAVKMPSSKPLTQQQILDLPPPVPVDLDFPAIKVALTLPNVIDGTCVCVRASRSVIDFLSESTRSFALPHEFEGRYDDLFTFNVKELIAVQKLKKEQDIIRNAFYKQIRERTREIEAVIKFNPYANLVKERDELDELTLKEPPFMPDPREFCGEQNMRNNRRFLKSCLGRLRPGEVNLRKYRICGGVLNLDLLVTPPQPKRMERGIHITSMELPKFLQWLEYKVLYRPPTPLPADIPRTPEVIEVELSRIQKEMEKLALIIIQLPKEILWNEQPIICQWHPIRHLWSSNYIIDYKYVEEKLQVQFRTGVMWPIGMATLRYCNVPFQGWDMKPDPKGKGVILIVTGLVSTVTFNIIHGYVKLVFISNTNTPALKDRFNKKFSVKKLVQMMRDAACDIFPDFDAHNYVEDTCPKEWAMERHVYHCMAFLCRSYNFQWSRWNVHAGFRKIIMQMREAVDPKREVLHFSILGPILGSWAPFYKTTSYRLQAKLNLLLVSPQHAVVLRRSENMPEWSEEPMLGMQFYSDLFTMNLTYGSIDARRLVFHQQFKLVETVFDLLSEIKLFRFS